MRELATFLPPGRRTGRLGALESRSSGAAATPSRRPAWWSRRGRGCRCRVGRLAGSCRCAGVVRPMAMRPAPYLQWSPTPTWSRAHTLVDGVLGPSGLMPQRDHTPPPMAAPQRRVADLPQPLNGDTALASASTNVGSAPYPLCAAGDTRSARSCIGRQYSPPGIGMMRNVVGPDQARRPARGFHRHLGTSRRVAHRIPARSGPTRYVIAGPRAGT